MPSNDAKSVALRIAEKKETELTSKTIGVNISLEEVVEEVLEAVK